MKRNHQGGTVTSWAAAQTLATTVASGASATFTSAPLGDGVIATPPLKGLQSFNIHLTAPSLLHIDWFTADGGGGTCTGSIYTVTGTIGQPEAGGPLTGSGYSLTGGFWAIYLVQTPGAPTLTITRSGNHVIVSWPSPSPGWTLKQNSSVAVANWTASSGIADDGTNKSLTLTSPAGNLFFRLKLP